MNAAPGPAADWPGKRLGLPERGPRSIARLAPRILALLIDWAIASLLSLAFFRVGEWQTDPFITLGVFAVLQIVPELFVGGSIGHLILRMRVVPAAGGSMRVWQSLVRTVLLCLVIPAVIWDRDHRGFHDLAARTILVRFRPGGSAPDPR